MKGALSTHVLDQAQGKPAMGVRVRVYRDAQFVVETWTNIEGRTDAPLDVGASFVPGAYRIEFAVGDYFASINHADARRFLDVVPIAFVVDDPAAGYHVPLLVTPWSYSTYRGS